jgi:LysM repeat protein
VKPSDAPAAAAPAPAKEKEAKAKPRPSKIKVGGKDTLESIAKQWNVSVASIMMENDLTNDKVHAGQTLKLPAAGR